MTDDMKNQDKSTGSKPADEIGSEKSNYTPERLQRMILETKQTGVSIANFETKAYLGSGKSERRSLYPKKGTGKEVS
jgi:hypothetical protein